MLCGNCSIETSFVTSVADSSYIYSILVPPNHILRRIKKEVDFNTFYPLVASLYNANIGRPAIPADVVGKLSFLQYLFNLSDRDVIDACQQRIDFKFFLDLPVESEAPCDASTLSRVRTRWGTTVFEKFFSQTVALANQKGLLGKERVVDSSKMLMNAAVLRSSQLFKRICDKLLKSIKEHVPSKTFAILSKEMNMLTEDTSWWLSSEAKEQHYLLWASFSKELAAAAQIVLDNSKDVEPPKAVIMYIELLKKHLDDRDAEEKLKALAKSKKQKNAETGSEDTSSKKNDNVPATAKHMSGIRKDKLVSDIDPDARQAADRKKKVRAGFKVHVSMDSKSEVITAVHTTPMNCDDGPHLPELMRKEREANQSEVTQVTADAAYSDGQVREKLQEMGITAFIPEPASKSSKANKFTTSAFKYDSKTNTLTCPANITCTASKVRKKTRFFYFTRLQCANCPLAKKCLSANGNIIRGRTVSMTIYRGLHEEAQALQKTEKHRAAMNRRLAVEHKQAEMLNIHGMRQARYRGLIKASQQVLITAIVTNVKRIIRLLDVQSVAQS